MSIHLPAGVAVYAIAGTASNTLKVLEIRR